MTGPHIVFGAGGIGSTPDSFTFTWDTPDKVASLLVLLKSLGLKELDSAAAYPPTNPWNANALLGSAGAGAAGSGFAIHDKVIPNFDVSTGQFAESLTDARIAASIEKSLDLLRVAKVPLLYSHTPDKHTPLEETARAFDRQHKLGKFDKVSRGVLIG